MSENIGEYNRYVTIEERSDVRDGLNQPLDVWVPVFSCWAKVRGQTGMSVIRDGGPVEAAVDRNSWRLLGYRSNVSNGMRLNYGGEYHYVKQVRLDRTNKDYTDLVCEGSTGSDTTQAIEYVGGGGASDTPDGYVGGGGA